MLEDLLVLQDKDTRVVQLQTELLAIPKERKNAEAKLAAAEKRFEDDTVQLRENEMAKKRLELAIQEKEQAIQKYKNQQLQTKKNEEYTALRHEIENAEKTISDLETQELELMEAADELQKEYAAAKQQLEDSKKQVAAQVEELSKREKNLRQRLEEGIAERQKIAAGIEDREALEGYQRLFRKKGGTAISPMKQGVCGACHMQLTATTINSVKGQREIVHCEQCSAMLYYDY